MNIRENVLSYLLARGWQITFAESCTGGLLCASLVDLPSASSVLAESYVTYANEAKVRLVGVSEETLFAYGAVSEQTATEMARGAAARAGAQVAVSVSGIAGPTGGTKEKPIGTVCFGFFINGAQYSCTEHFGALGRSAVRQASVEFAFRKLAELLEKNG